MLVNKLIIKDEGTVQGTAGQIDFVGSGVTASISGNLCTITISGGAGSDIALSLLSPTTDETITAGNSAIISGTYTIASGKKLTIGLASRFQII